MNQNSNKITNKNIMVENINRLLYQKNWSIRQLADEAELPYESVKKLVGGKVNNPTIYTISKVCDALNCSIDYILGRSVINTIDKKSLPPRVFNLLVEIAYFESRIADYNKWANEASQLADSATKTLFERLISAEEEHLDIFDTELGNLETFGDGYLSLQAISHSKEAAKGSVNK